MSVDPRRLGTIDAIIRRIGLRQSDEKEEVYFGQCPMCGWTDMFYLWPHNSGFQCFACGAIGSFKPPHRREEKRWKASPK